jgi:hypothetical protein
MDAKTNTSSIPVGVGSNPNALRLVRRLGGAPLALHRDDAAAGSSGNRMQC